MENTVTIIEAIIGNYLDDSNRSILVAISTDDKSNFIGRSKDDAKSMLQFIGVEIGENDFLYNITIPNIYLGATMQQQVQPIKNPFKYITNRLLY
jgi:hypothetical protein